MLLFVYVEALEASMELSPGMWKSTATGSMVMGKVMTCVWSVSLTVAVIVSGVPSAGAVNVTDCS